MQSDDRDAEMPTPDFTENERVPRKFIDWADSLSGKTLAVNWKHVIARHALLNELRLDERFESLWQKWGEWTGLNETISRVVNALETVAAAAELEHRGFVTKLWREGKGPEYDGMLQKLAASTQSKR